MAIKTTTLLVLTTLALCASHACCTDVGNEGNAGGWHNATVNEETTSVLKKALANDQYYGDSITIRLCYSSIESVRTQVVEGMNYEFKATSCVVDKAANGQGQCPSTVLTSCQPNTYTIDIYERVWTNTLNITRIEGPGANSTPTPTPANNSNHNDITTSPGVPTPSPSGASALSIVTTTTASLVLGAVAFLL